MVEVPQLHTAQVIRAPQVAAGLFRRRHAYGRPLLLDPEGHADLAVNGFHVDPEPIPSEAIEQLLEGCNRWIEDSGAPADGRFRSSYSTLHEPAGREVRTCVSRVLLPALRSHVVPGAFLRPSVFQVKPADPASGLRMHQDRAFVDEGRSFALQAWVALTDVTIDDGPLVVLPGSHRFGVWSRVPAETDPLGAYQEAMERRAVALPVRAGQIIWFDAALVHGSLVNQGRGTRLGVSAVATHRSDPIAIAREPSWPDARTTTVHQVHPSSVSGDRPPPLEEEPVVGLMDRDDLRFRAATLGAVASAHRLLHRRAPQGVALPEGATCLS